ncbi:MAG: sugar phosphate isomerase/epimerase [Isosphaeraceae bacterium]|nr:sugar phosphate isomerase/epimerase [Isosphaeraceae bacterium]
MTIQSCVTISLVPQARGGPFVFWDDLAEGCRKAAALGFDAVEVFPPSPDAVDPSELRRLLAEHRLKLAAVGTGAGWVVQRLTLTHADVAQRARAQEFVRSIIDFAGPFGASAIIGSMQGRWGDGVTREDGLAYLGEALNALGEHAAQYGVPLLYEPLNRYETNFVNTVADGVGLLGTLTTRNVKLLADLFHMNIEEADIAAAIRAGAGSIGHVHFVDSNRRPAGFGHVDFVSVANALHAIGYNGYASAEALPYPDSDAAARRTIDSFHRYFRASEA